MAVTVEKVKEKVLKEETTNLVENKEKKTKKIYEKPIFWAVGIGVITISFFTIRAVKRNGSKIVDIE